MTEAAARRADDEAHLAAAIALGRRSLGETWPNPAVGCVVVAADGAVVGRGRTQAGGRPHAETEALAAAGARARGATAYVTLEPCSHHGLTPPCADALIGAGVARVVGGAGDPDPRVDGRGFRRLRDAGIAVETGLLAPAIASLASGFVSRVTQGRPRVTLKLATSLDGRIANAHGESRWITGPAARRAVHLARARHDAVLVGIGTALADDPLLTVRLAGARTRPIVRVVADRGLRLPLASRLVATATEHPLWLLHGPAPDPARAAALRDRGVRLVATDGALPSALAALGAAGLNTLFVEGGAAIAASLLDARLVDELLWFTAPLILGGDAVGAIGRLAPVALEAAARFGPVDSGAAAHDLWIRATTIAAAGREG